MNIDVAPTIGLCTNFVASSTEITSPVNLTVLLDDI